jgi:hypothetical protein
MKELSFDVIKMAVKNNGYKWFEDKLNIVGIRTKDTTTDLFNDFIVVAYTSKNGEEPHNNFIGFNATTDPGLYYLNNPMNVKGTGILVEGQYIDCWQKGNHKGHDALIQCRPVSVYRDNDRDNYLTFDKTTIDTGYFGLNIHRAHVGIIQKLIGKYSAACQVIQSNSAYEKFYKICLDSGQKYFTYTLLNETQL